MHLSLALLRVVGGGITIYAREFQFWDQLRLASRVRIGFNPARTQITSVTSLDEKLGLFQLEGRLFGSVSPLSHEDRELLTLEQIPEGLITALVSIEDRNFFSHWGISPIGIFTCSRSKFSSRPGSTGWQYVNAAVSEKLLFNGRTYYFAKAR